MGLGFGLSFLWLPRGAAQKDCATPKTRPAGSACPHRTLHSKSTHTCTAPARAAGRRGFQLHLRASVYLPAGLPEPTPGKCTLALTRAHLPEAGETTKMSTWQNPNATASPGHTGHKAGDILPKSFWMDFSTRTAGSSCLLPQPHQFQAPTSIRPSPHPRTPATLSLGGGRWGRAGTYPGP